MPSKTRSDLTIGTLVPASLASVAATFLLARLGLTGTLLGAALIPIIIAVVRELSRPPAEGVAKATKRGLGGSRAETPTASHSRDHSPPGPSATWNSRLSFLSWRRILLTGTAAFAITIAVFTIPELVLGESVADDRRTTFFTPTSSETDDQDQTESDQDQGEKEQPAPETDPPAPEDPGNGEIPADMEPPAEPEDVPPPEGEERPRSGQETP